VNRFLQALRPLVTPVALLLTGGILLLDLGSPLGIEVEILYLVPLLLLLRSPSRRAAVALAVGYTGLIAVGAVWSPTGSPLPFGIAMRIIVATILWATTILVLRAKRAEERLFQAQKEQQVIFDSVPAMIWYKDAENRIVRANRTAANSLGLSVQDMEGRSAYDLYPQQAQQYYQAELEVIRSGRSQFGIVEPYQTASGEKRWIRTDKIPYRDHDGRVIGVIVFAVDITDSEQLAAIEASRDGIAVVDAHGTFAYVNRAFAKLHGVEQAQELIGTPWRTLLEQREAERFEQQVVPLVNTQRHWQGEAVGVRRDWSVFPQDLSLTALEHGGIVCVLHDISERKRTEAALRASEEHLRQSQKMDAVGRLAGGIAHEFNNLLTVMLGRSHLLLGGLGNGHPLARHAQQIQEAGQRAAGLTQQLLALSRKQALQPSTIQLNDLIAAMSAVFQPLLGERIEFRAALAADLGWILADRGQIEHAILSLVLNARDAMPTGGRLTITTENVAGNQRLAQRLSLNTPGTHVMLSVSDTGQGMDAYTKEHCFDPFFTTKGQGQGTGLGLATVYGIVNQSGGLIDVASAPGQGATFRLFLPQVAPPTAATPTPAPAPKRGGGAETILLVEDEPMVRDVTRGILRAKGYTVLEAGEGREALRICLDHPDTIHLLLTDVMMPGMNGQELAERILALRPDIRVLFASGYTADVAPFGQSLGRTSTLLVKPFTPDVLEQKVREVLDASD